MCRDLYTLHHILLRSIDHSTSVSYLDTRRIYTNLIDPFDKTLWYFYGFTTLGLAITTYLIVIAYKRKICPAKLNPNCDPNYLLLRMIFGITEPEELIIVSKSTYSTGKNSKHYIWSISICFTLHRAHHDILLSFALLDIFDVLQHWLSWTSYWTKTWKANIRYWGHRLFAKQHCLCRLHLLNWQ